MYVYGACLYVCCSDCVGVCGNVCCVAAVVKNSVFFSLGMLKYVVCLCRGCDGCCVFCLYCEAWSCRCPCMGSVSVSSCRCGNVCCVAAVVKNSVFFSLGMLKYVVCLCRGCDGCCVFCLYCEAWSCRCPCMGSVIVSSCRCCMFVSCVHPVAVPNAAFYMTCSL